MILSKPNLGITTLFQRKVSLITSMGSLKTTPNLLTGSSNAVSTEKFPLNDSSKILEHGNN
jgi:hypothetical protein